MILHCTLPYKHTISNPALGYLKGFLQAEGIQVKNIYWNVLLIKKISSFLGFIRAQSERSGVFTSKTLTFYILEHLLRADSPASAPSKSHVLFSSIFSPEQLSNMVATIKEDIDTIILQNKLHEVPIAGFTLKTFQWLMGHYLISRLKALNPDIQIVVGGIYDTDQAMAFMRFISPADFALWGEGEVPLVRLVKALQDETSVEAVPNLVYRQGNTITSTGKVHTHTLPLDDYPFADHTDYFDTVKKLALGPMLILTPIWGSRSCNWNKCKFCVLNKGYFYRTRSPESIVEEIEYQSQTHNIDNFIFVDSDVAGNKKRFKHLLKLLIESVERRGKPYKLLAEASPLFIDQEIARYMKLASFVQTQIGFEATADSMLQRMQKRHRFAHNIQVLKLGDEHGLDLVGLNILKGLPGETKEEILESSINLKFLRFFFNRFELFPNHLVLFKGSIFYEEMLEEERSQWNTPPYWADLTPMDLIPDSDRFEFSGFSVDRLNHHLLWQDFDNLIKFYVKQACYYEWFDYNDGSFIEEKGLIPMRHALDKDETALLVYCDKIRTFPQIQRAFSHLSEEDLLRSIQELNTAGLLYCDDSKRNIISIVTAAKRQRI